MVRDLFTHALRVAPQIMYLFVGDCTRDMIVLNLGGGQLAMTAKLAIGECCLAHTTIDTSFFYHWVNIASPVLLT